MAKRFSELTREGGALILSGLLATQVDECLASYDPWFDMGEPVFREEWAMLEGIRSVRGV